MRSIGACPRDAARVTPRAPDDKKIRSSELQKLSDTNEITESPGLKDFY